MSDPLELLSGSSLLTGEWLLVVFFLYGLGFVLLGSVILVKKRRLERVDLTESFSYLGAFGLVHGVMEWMDLARLAGEIYSLPHPPTLDAAKLVLLVVSYASLLQFAVNILTLRRPEYAAARYAPLAAGTGFLAVAVGLGSYDEALTAGRHTFGLAAPLLATAALLSLRRICGTATLLPLRRSASMMAAGFGVYTVFSGVVTFPVAGVPPQVVRMLCALVIGYAAAYLLTELETTFGLRGAR